MQLETPKHEWIRFRRGEICDLDTLPSAVGQKAPPAARKPPSSRPAVSRGVLRVAARTLGAIAGLVLLAVVGLYLLGISGIGAERLRIEAEAALKRAAGPNMAATVGPANISFDGASLIALNIRDLAILQNGTREVEAGTLRFGIRILPLLRGDVRLGSAKITDARIVVPALTGRGSGDWTASLRNEDGLVDPDLAGEALFDTLRQALDTLRRAGTGRIDLENTELVLAETGRIRSLIVSRASLSDNGDGSLSLAARGALDGRDINLEGTARQAEDGRRIADLRLKLDLAPSQPLELSASGTLSDDGSKSRIGSVGLVVAGSENENGGGRLSLSAKLEKSVIDLGKRGVLVSDADIDATLLVGSNKIEIDRLVVATGKSRFVMNGAIGPQPAGTAPPGKLAYRYEFVADDAVLAPLDSPEAPIQLTARMAGRFDERTLMLTADELAVRTANGEVAGTASVDFERGKTPGLALTVSSSNMPVSQVKQLWPWIAAGKARQWALANFLGGSVVECEIAYRVAPGRLGDGIPLNRDEIHGRFKVTDSRFDTTGSLPPIRDARGSIEFSGNDVDIVLDSGTAYLSGDRRIDVSNGRLVFRDANVNPVVGLLDLDIAGRAEAVAELASLEPINAMRRLDMQPADFSGDVKGHVRTQVPLDRATDLSTLKWQVDLNTGNLDIAKPFSGQKIADMNGLIRVDQDAARIDASATLNGVPAKLAIVEPLRAGGPKRRRDIELTLDDKRRRLVAPGLDDLVSGTMTLKVDAAAADGTQKVQADMAGTKLSIPWVGWSKGTGVPASLAFDLRRDGTVLRLADFKLSGATFGISGDVRIESGALASAKFGNVQLNRGDAARVSITRRGKSYAVAVDADAFDARALIKRIVGSADGGGSSSDGTSAISLEATVGKLAGFNDEALMNARLEYQGGGAQPTYTLSAVTDNGGAVSISNAVDGGQSAMRIQSADAGSLVRFLDIYDHMRGGQVDVSLRGQSNGVMRGQVNVSNFYIVNESRLGSIVSTKAPGGGGRSLNDVVKRDIDTSSVDVRRSSATIEKGPAYLRIEGGVLRGSMIGATFQGTLYDQAGNIDMTGTFMPAYGLNRLFAELPIIGIILGNGRDRGLIGVTFKLEGKAAKPRLQVNPLSVIAPGIFRQIFEFR
ncbi:MAG: hypothetical protein J0H34_20900 [Rhizobiales bacterium]|nr:hypothetical protein [Hyphomicrobiales bacterium]